jgi:hypothetical protein
MGNTHDIIITVRAKLNDICSEKLVKVRTISRGSVEEAELSLEARVYERIDREHPSGESTHKHAVSKCPRTH